MPQTQTLLFGTYNLTGIDRIETNLYRARSGAATLLIETRLCLALTLMDDGVLRWQGVAGSQLVIDSFSGDVCDVSDAHAI